VRYLAPEQFVHSPETLALHWTPAQAQDYTRWLATHHYENFHVASVLLPRRLHQDFYNVYSFCRWADDLGDEIEGKAEALRLLEWWTGLLNAMYEGEAWHPVFVALRTTVRKYGIPKQPFADLIHAFVQDQTVTRYRTMAELDEYCRYSANPVGRLVLYLCGYADAERQRLSDFTCTALQMANHWQDVSVDLRKNRVYIPAEVMKRHGYTYEDLFALRETDAFRRVMKEIVDRARHLFIAGLPLTTIVDRRLSIDLDLFSRGGMRVLDKIEEQKYGVLSKRPAVGRIERVGLLLSSLARTMFTRSAA
jgi:squalene synthase HpnC